LAAESLARDRQGIELMNVRQQAGAGHRFRAQGKLTHFEKLITAYAERRISASGRCSTTIR
jgi:hypothetical protein